MRRGLGLARSRLNSGCDLLLDQRGVDRLEHGQFFNVSYAMEVRST